MLNEKIQKAIAEAAIKAQADLARFNGEFYQLEDLKATYTDWLYQSIERIIEEMPAATGTNRHAYNNSGFAKVLERVQPDYTVDDEYDQMIFDQILAA